MKNQDFSHGGLWLRVACTKWLMRKNSGKMGINMIAHIQETTGQEQTVLKHLKDTAALAKRIGGDMDMGNLSYFTALFHDLGKWRKKFEDYIRMSAAGGHCTGGKLNHSSAGGIYISEHYYKGSPVEKLSAQLIAAAIFSHHGLMDILSPEGKPVYIQRVENKQDLDYEEVIHNLTTSALIENDKDLFKKAVDEVTFFMNKIEILAKNIALQEMDAGEKKKKEGTAHFYFIAIFQRMLLSVLIDSDRLDTASFCSGRPVNVIGLREESIWQQAAVNLEKYLLQFRGKDKISLLRRQIADDCREFAEKGSGIYRLSVPTGGAKTLSSLRYAVFHAKEYNKKRIFYLAPYLSILEQNAEVFREALSMDEYVLEHHSNVIMDHEKDGPEQATYKYLTENWEAPIIITTFVQFLNSLFSDRTQDIRRFHNLADSVIIIDEIQSLPIKMIDNFNLVINMLHEVFHTTIVLCSATQPVLEQTDYPLLLSEERDIIADYNSLYEALKRVEVKTKKGCFDSGQLTMFAVEIMKEQDNLLIILNTKKAVQSVFHMLGRYYDELGEESVAIIHLSTNMCAKHRLLKINEIKQKLGKEKLICISTNLIEAGVDLSFACVIRSFAGLDCIAQAAGRCNRNGEMGDKLGIVYLIHMKEECLGRLVQIRIGATCSEDIVNHYEGNEKAYDNSLISPKAMEVFYNNYYYSENQKRLMKYPVKESGTTMLDLLSRNKKGINGYIEKYGTDAVFDLRYTQAFKTAGENFRVIEKETIGVIVPYGEGKELITKLNGRPELDRAAQLIRKAQRYTVNLYRNQIEELSKAGALVNLLEGRVTALKEGFYDDNTGVDAEGHMGLLLVD